MKGVAPIATCVCVASLATARADAPVAVVVRSAGAQLAVARLRGQLADVGEVAIAIDDAPLPATLDDQLAQAAALADARGAKAVVWFVARGAGGLAVAIATPGDGRLFVRELPHASASSMAEAAAVAARGALKAIAAGGSIGVLVHPETESAPEPAPVVGITVAAPPPAPPAAPAVSAIELALGWQVALDGGADRGAHAIALRATLARARWAGSLALADGLATRRTDGDIATELARSLAGLGVEYRVGGGVALGALAGVVRYDRATVAAPLAPTPPRRTTAATVQAELAWRYRPGAGHVGVVARLAVAVVAGAPELAVAEPDMVRTLGAVHAVQGCADVAVFVRWP